MAASDYKAEFIQGEVPSAGVLHLAVGRTPVNAFNTSLWRSLASLVIKASRDPDVKVVVLSSSLPKIFTAGLDFQDPTLGQTGEDPARTAFLLRDHILEFQGAISELEKCAKPVIAAMHGLVLGLGVDIASACDIRLASEDARFSIKEVDIGLAADIGSLQRFPKKVGNDSIVRELAFTARFFDAKEAKGIGFLSRVVQGGRDGVVASALELAKVISAKSPVAVVGSKHILNYSRDRTVADGLEYTAAWNMSMLQAADVADAIQATMSKQPGSFKPLPKL